MAKNNIPADELLLAEAIAAAKARDWKWTAGAMFRNRQWRGTVRRSHATVGCCAFGALIEAGVHPRIRATIPSVVIAVVQERHAKIVHARETSAMCRLQRALPPRAEEK